MKKGKVTVKAEMEKRNKIAQTQVLDLNIARGTTDPEIDSETWTKLGNNMAPSDGQIWN